MLILLLNVYAPSSPDVRVFKYTVPIVSQVRGRVIEVPVSEGNRPVKKGEVLFRIDPTPYQLTVNQLQAQLANAEAQQRQLDESLNVAKAKVVESTKGIEQASAQNPRSAGEDAACHLAGAAKPRAGDDRGGQQVRAGERRGGPEPVAGSARIGARR